MTNGLGGQLSETYYGAAGDDSLRGEYGDDDLYGGNGDDSLYGGEGSDDLYGSSGDDHIYGGLGSDRAHFTGAHDEYDVLQSGTTQIIRDRQLLRDGSDSVEDVELLQFSDLTTILNYDNSGIYRFYNTQTGSHFYTGDKNEAENTLTTMPNFQYDGRAFSENQGLSNTVDVHRFYNTQTGTHFFTSNEAEIGFITENLPAYKYEGKAYQAYSEAQAGTTALHRFYNSDSGIHFYTASQSEMETVKIELSGTYSYDGIAYYVGQ